MPAPRTPIFIAYNLREMASDPKEVSSPPFRNLRMLVRLLILARWLILLIAGLVFAFALPRIPSRWSPFQAILFVGVYSLVASLIALKRPRSLVRRSWLWLLWDGAVALGILPFTGGYMSPFFLLVLLVVLEIALFFPWKTALALLATVDALQVAASVFHNLEPVDPLSVINRFVALLLFGSIAVLFVQVLRWEEQERLQAMRRARQERALNEIFVKLGESRMDLQRVLQVIVESARDLLNARAVLILTPEDARSLKVAAVWNLPSVQPGQTLPRWPWLPRERQLVPCERGREPWPPVVQNPEIRHVLCAPLRTAGGEIQGWLLLGYETAPPTDSLDLQLVRALALEGSLALANARLLQREQAHVQELRRFDALRSTFFSAIAHELKTPLTVLKTLVASLDRYPSLPEATQREIRQSLEANLNRLETLISETLESARLEARSVRLHPGPVHLVARIHRVVNRLQPLFQQKQLTVQVLAPEPGPVVRADPRFLDRILENLLENAAKFSPEQGILQIRVQVAEEQATVCVADQGPGIPPEARDRVFEKFYTSPASSSQGGVGLGLYIVRELVRLHGGRIWIQDATLGGSEFCFTLPLYTEEETDESGYQADSGD